SRRYAPFADSALFVRAFHSQLHRPKWPGSLRCALWGRHRQQFELMYGAGFVSMGGAQAVSTGVASANDDHSLAGRQNGFGFRNPIAFATLVLLRQKLHREVDAFQLPARHWQVARMLGAAAQQDGVKITAQIFDRNIVPDVRAGLKLNTFPRHLLDPPVDQM